MPESWAGSLACRSLATQTIPLNAALNSSCLPNNARWLARLRGGRCVKQTVRGFQPGPSNSTSIRYITPTASSRIAREFGRPVATGKQAKAICKIGVFYDSVAETLARNGFAPNPLGGHQGYLHKAVPKPVAPREVHAGTARVAELAQ